MSVLCTEGHRIDRVTGLPIQTGSIITTENGLDITTQATGEPPGGLNTSPGTDPHAPGNSDPGLPYGYDTVPTTGPITDY